jgi:hypothetical protein
MAEQSKRTNYRALAARKYPRFYFVGGDGEWIVLTKCYHDQVKQWRYALQPTQEAAEALMTKWTAERCGRLCKGDHTIWRING